MKGTQPSCHLNFVVAALTAILTQPRICSMKKNKSVWLTITLIALAIVAGSLAVFGVLGSRNEALAAGSTPVATKPWPTVPATSTPTPTFTPTPLPGPTAPPTPTPTPTPRVQITDIRGLGRLETVEYVMEAAIDLEKEPENAWQRIIGIFGTDKVLLLAGGEVVAGVDLTRITPSDAIVQGDRITLWLPKPEIFYTRVDNQETQVYLREKGLFYPYDKDLETQARRNAEQAMKDKALRHDILDKAGENAVRDMEQFLRSLGFTDITVIIRQ